MRYLQSNEKESFESNVISSDYGKKYFPLTNISIDSECVVDNSNVKLISLEGEITAIRPETASWVFLSTAEAQFYRQLSNKKFSWIIQNWPSYATSGPQSFVGELYRKGLLTINGNSSVDNDIFKDSPNIPDSNLVELLLTEKCNLGCGYCLAGTNPKMPTMTDEIAFKTIDLAFEMKEARSLTFEFSGGEPFMKFELMKKLTKYIHNHPDRNYRNVYVITQTNATLLNPDRVRWLKENNVGVGVSIDGNPKAHNQSRPFLNGSGSFTNVMEGIKLLRKFDVPFSVIVVLNRFNVDSVENLVDFLIKNNIQSVKINPISYIGTARRTWDEFGLTSEEVVNWFKKFLNIILNKRHPIYEDNIATMMKYLISKQRGTRCMRSHCGAGETFQTINANGDIFPCGRATQTPDMAMGNVLINIKSLSTPSKSNSIIKQIKNRRPDDLDGCMDCHYKQMCQAGCSVQAYEKYGTVRHRTPECDFYKTLYPFLMRLLCFDNKAVEFFNYLNYFGDPVNLNILNYFNHEIIQEV